MTNKDKLPCEAKLNAVYGTFTLDMQPYKTIDVTDHIRALISNGTLMLPKNFSFRELLAGNLPQKKFLQIKLGERTINIAEDKYDHDITINLLQEEKSIVIVYYLYLNPLANWRAIVSGQLLQLKSYGILAEADLYIHITDEYGLAQKAIQIISEIAPQAVISVSTQNQFEYPGIKLVYTLAKQYAERTFIYFHSKGMSYGLHSRSVEDITLMYKTFNHWRKNISYLNQNGISKVGVFPAKATDQSFGNPGDEGGYIFYNFWYASGKYLNTCQPPVITNDRYYYEKWLGIRKGEDKAVIRDDCKSLYDIKGINKTYFSPTETAYHQQRIIHKLNSYELAKKVPYLMKSSLVLQFHLMIKLFFQNALSKRLLKSDNKLNCTITLISLAYLPANPNFYAMVMDYC